MGTEKAFALDHSLSEGAQMVHSRTSKEIPLMNRIVAILVAVAGLATFNSGLSYAQSWFDANWSYRCPITISNPGASTLTDYQVKIALNSSFDFTKEIGRAHV